MQTKDKNHDERMRAVYEKIYTDCYLFQTDAINYAKKMITKNLAEAGISIDELEIVSGGQKDGSDGYAKKYALEFDIKYSEFPPQHYPHNIHCVRPNYDYGKPYYVSNYFKRNKQVAEYSDRVVAFVTNPNKITSGTLSTLQYAEKMNKKSIIIDWIYIYICI